MKQFRLPIIVLAAMPLMLQAAPTFRQDFSQVEGENGVVHFSGNVYVAPCVLDPQSREQYIDLGDISARLFHQSGDRSKLIPFTLRLRDCLRGASQSASDITSQSVGQPTQRYTSGEQAVSLRLEGESSPINQDLLRIQGAVKGAGIRLLDDKGHALALNQKANTWLLSPGDNELQLNAALESTQSSISAGDFRSLLRLIMEYQ
ncbi:fimbrial protein [Hafnia sp. HMSC23F03]|uniref:fimbrial protein n=1 Tax=Hafnia sp. HMSC23F03 TaxID=1581059 RepID=UPI0008A41AB2|nr:fimbrial protein [Hafnia sp. HMSC23F03]OFS08507.1 fimbrial protein [Hafnia sp. HMSC23F03]